jgi:predicted LPLAT superfamily acyltransferase
MKEETAMRWREVREKGSLWGMLFTAKVCYSLGRWAAEPVLWCIAGYFFLKDRRMRRISRQYLQRVMGTGDREKTPGWTQVYRHYLSFARASMDRFDVWTDRLTNYTFHNHGEDHLIRLLEQGKGAVLLGAHLGNFDMLRALAKRRGGKVHVLTDRANSKMFSAVLRRFSSHMDEGLVEYNADSLDAVFDLKRAVERGEFVGLLGDRLAAVSARGSRRVSPAMFLGETALFPQSPFLFAAHLECPVFLLFGLRRSNRVYDMYVEPFAERIDLDGSRDDALARYASAFAARLEYYCRQFPLQWFNFYDFWGKQS